MTFDDHFVVVGFGPVGAFCALRLALRFPAARITVIESKRHAEHTARERPFYAAHLSRAAIDALAAVDAWSTVPARHDYAVRYEVQGRLVLSFRNDEFRNCFVPQCFVEDALRVRCESMANIQIRYETRFVSAQQRDDRVLVSLQSSDGVEQQLDAAFLFACDGASSSVRRSLGIAFDGETRRRWCVCDFRCAGIEALVPDMVWSINDVRPGMYVSLYRDHFRLEFCVADDEPDAKFQQGVDASLLAGAHFVPADIATLVRAKGELLRASAYRMHSRMAERFQEGRVLLLGDAAHLTEPFTGAGVSNGFADVEHVVPRLPSVGSYTADRRRALWWKHSQAAVVGFLLHLQQRWLLRAAAPLLASSWIPQSLKMVVVRLLL
jgi:3-(3-hydroxy-phenyl)propionate hydroxylase